MMTESTARLAVLDATQLHAPNGVVTLEKQENCQSTFQLSNNNIKDMYSTNGFAPTSRRTVFH